MEGARRTETSVQSDGFPFAMCACGPMLLDMDESVYRWPGTSCPEYKSMQQTRTEETGSYVSCRAGNPVSSEPGPTKEMRRTG